MKCKIKDNFLRKKKKENGHYIQYTDTKNKKKNELCQCSNGWKNGGYYLMWQTRIIINQFHCLREKNGMFQQQKTHWQIHHLFIEMNKFIQ